MANQIAIDTVTNVAASKTNIASLNDAVKQLQNIAAQKTQLNVDTSVISAKIAALQLQERQLKQEMSGAAGNTSVPVDAPQQLAGIQAQIKDLQNQKLVLKVDTSELSAAGAQLRQQLGAVPQVGAQAENALTRVGSAANKAGTSVYFASFGLTALKEVNPIFGTMAAAMSNASGYLSLAGPLMETLGKKTQTTGAQTAAAASQIEGANGEIVASNEAAAASQKESSAAVMGGGAVAIAAAVGLGVLTTYLTHNNAAEQAHAQMVKDDSKALLDNNGALSQSVIQQNALTLATEGVYSKLMAEGVAMRTVTEASDGSADAAKELWSQVQGQSFETQVAAEKALVMGGAVNEARSASEQAAEAAGVYAANLAQSSAEAQAAAASYDQAAQAAINYLSAAANDAGAAIDQSNASVQAAISQDAFTNAVANFNQTISAGGGGGTKKIVQAVVDVLGDYNTELDLLSNNEIDATEQQDKFNQSLTDAAKQKDPFADPTASAIDNKDAVLDQIKAINQIASAQLKAGQSADTVTAQMKANEDQLLANAKATGLTTDQVKALIDQFAVNPSQLTPAVLAKEAADAAAAAKKAADDYSGSIGAQTVNLTRNKDAMLDLINKMNQQAQDEIKAGVPIDQVTGKLKANEDQLYAVGRQAGMTQDQVKQFIDQYGVSADQLAAQVAFDFANMGQNLTTYMGLLKNAETQGLGETFASQVPVYSGGSLSATVGHYAGGPWSAATGGARGGWGTMNEHGAENVRLPNGSTVISAPDSQRMNAGLSGSGGPIMIQFIPSGNAIVDGILELLRGAVRVQGGDVQHVLGQN